MHIFHNFRCDIAALGGNDQGAFTHICAQLHRIDHSAADEDGDGGKQSQFNIRCQKENSQDAKIYIENNIAESVPAKIADDHRNNIQPAGGTFAAQGDAGAQPVDYAPNNSRQQEVIQAQIDLPVFADPQKKGQRQHTDQTVKHKSFADIFIAHDENGNIQRHIPEPESRSGQKIEDDGDAADGHRSTYGRYQNQLYGTAMINAPKRMPEMSL